MKKILSYICILISFTVAEDHAPRNISPTLEILGNTTRCIKTQHYDDFERWICVDANGERYYDVTTTYVVEVDFELGRWEISYTNRTVNCDDTLYYTKYIASYKDTTISEYRYHYDDTTRVVDEWQKGKVHYERLKHQILAIRAFTENKLKCCK